MNGTELLYYVEKAIEGDKEAFATLCQHKAQDVLYICTKLMGNKHDGEDAAQEVFVVMQKNIHQLKAPQSFTAWCNRIIHTTCSRLRHKRQRGGGDMPIETLFDQLEEGNAEFLPQEFAETQEKRDIVLEALEALPYRYRQALLLFYFENLSTKQVAATLGINIKSVENRLYKARRSLKKQIQKRAGALVEADNYAYHGGALVLTRILRMDAARAVTRESVAKIAAIGAAETAAAATAAGAFSATAAGAAAFTLPGWVIPTAAGVAVAAAAITIGASTMSPAISPSISTAAPPVAVQHSPGAGAMVDANIPVEDTDASFTEQAGESTASANAPGAAGSPNGPRTGDEGEPVATPTASAPQTSQPATSTPQTGGAGNSGNGNHNASSDKDHNTSGKEDNNTASSNGATSSTPGNKTLLLTGQFAFVDRAGIARPAYNTAAEGFTLAVYDGETRLAQATADETGAFAFLLENPPRTLTLEADFPLGFGPAEGESTPLIIHTSEESFCTVEFTDTMAPSAALHFVDEQGRRLEGDVNPAGARLTVYDATTVTVAWHVQDEAGQTVLSGRGRSIGLATGLADGGTYTLVCTLTDAAGNTTTIEREFALLY